MSKISSLIIGLLLSINVTMVSSKIIPLDELFREPDTLGASLNQEGSFFVIHETTDEFHRIILSKTEEAISGVVLQVEKTYGGSINNFYWVDNNTLFVEYRSDENDEFSSGFLDIALKDNKLNAKLHKIKSKGYIVSARLAIDNQVLFARNDKESWKIDSQLFIASHQQLIDGNLDSAKVIPYGLKNAKRYFYDSSNDHLMAVKVSGEDVSFWKLENKTKKWKIFLDLEEYDFHMEPIGFLNETTLAVLSKKDTDLTSLFEFDIESQTLGKMLYQHEKYDLVGGSVNEKLGQPESVTYFDHGRLETYYFSNKDSKINEIFSSAFVDKQFVVISSSKKRNKHLLYVFSSNDSGSYYYIDMDSYKAEKVAEKYRGLEKYSLAKTQVSSIVTDEGANIELLFTQPKKGSNATLIVMPHGGPIGVREYDQFDPKVQFLTSRGYSTLKLNFSGSSGFGEKFKKQGVAQFGKRIESEISQAVDFILKKHSYKNICSMGASYGGYSSIMLAIQNPDRFQCAVASFGIYDLPLLFNQSNLNTQGDKRKSIENVVGEMRTDLWESSPLYSLEKLHAPILLIAGEKDSVASVEHTNRMKYRLNQLDKKFDSLFYKKAGHGHPRWFGDRHEMAYTDTFLRKTLNLPVHLDKNTTAIKKQEHRIIADGFSSKKFLTPNNELALYHYKEAAKLGDGISQLNVGSYYHRGDGVEEDLDQAIVWYKKASKNGEKTASYRLASLYNNGEAGKTSDAFEYYQKAVKQGHKLAFLDVAKSYCTGQGVAFNSKKCISQLTLEDDGKKVIYQRTIPIRKHRIKVLNDIVWDKQYPILYKQGFDQFLRILFKIDDLNITAEVDEEGWYLRNRWGSYRLEENTSLVPLKKDARFGVALNFLSDLNVDRKKAISAVKYRWIIPESISNDKSIDVPNGNMIKADYIDGVKNFYYAINQDWEMVEGDWTLEIMTLDNKPLYKRTFTTYVPKG